MSKEGSQGVTLTQVFTIVIGVTTAVFAGTGFGYYFGQDSAKSEIAVLKRDIDLLTSSKGAVELMKSLETLKVANENLFRFEAHAQEIDALNQSVMAANTEISKLLDNLSDRDGHIQELSVQLKDSEAEAERLGRLLRKKHSVSESFSLPHSRSKSFFDGALIVGVNSVYGSWENINILGGSENLDVGESYPFGINGTACELSYLGVTASGKEADFSLICS